jgi:RNase P/RNase MRP subunit p29
MSVITERVFKCITASGHKCLDLSSQLVIMEAERSVTISKKQVLLEFKIDGDALKHLSG